MKNKLPVLCTSEFNLENALNFGDSTEIFIDVSTSIVYDELTFALFRQNKGLLTYGCKFRGIPFEENTIDGFWKFHAWKPKDLTPEKIAENLRRVQKGPCSVPIANEYYSEETIKKGWMSKCKIFWNKIKQIFQ